MTKKGAIQDKPEPGLKALALRMYADGAPWDEISDSVPWKQQTIVNWASESGIPRGVSRHNDIADAADLRLKHSYAEPERIAVEVGARVLNKHRNLLRSMRSTLVDMLAEIDDCGEEAAENAAIVRELYAAKAIADPMGATRYRARLEKALDAMTLPGRVKTMSTLVGAAGAVIDHERRAYRMDKDVEGPGEYERILKAISDEKKRLEKMDREESHSIIEGVSNRVD